MVELSTQSCEACRIDAPRVSEEEISSLMLEIPNWNLEKDSINKLKSTY